MDYSQLIKKHSNNCYFVLWKDPQEGDGLWKSKFDSKASININVGWMERNPNDPTEWVLYCSKDSDQDIHEFGSEIYIPEGCIIYRNLIIPSERGEHFETNTIIKTEKDNRTGVSEENYTKQGRPLRQNLPRD